MITLILSFLSLFSFCLMGWCYQLDEPIIGDMFKYLGIALFLIALMSLCAR